MYFGTRVERSAAVSSAKDLVPVGDLDSYVAELGAWSLAPAVEGLVRAASALGLLLAKAAELAETDPTALPGAIAALAPAGLELCAQVGRASEEPWGSPGDVDLVNAALSTYAVRRDLLLGAIIQCTPTLIWDLTQVLDPIHTTLRQSRFWAR